MNFNSEKIKDFISRIRSEKELFIPYTSTISGEEYLKNLNLYHSLRTEDKIFFSSSIGCSLKYYLFFKKEGADNFKLILVDWSNGQINHMSIEDILKSKDERFSWLIDYILFNI